MYCMGTRCGILSLQRSLVAAVAAAPAAAAGSMRPWPFSADSSNSECRAAPSSSLAHVGTGINGPDFHLFFPSAKVCGTLAGRL